MARSLASIMGSIEEMSDAAIIPDLFAVLYSEFGVGKTVAVMGIAQAIRGDGDILFCDSSDGWTSLTQFEGFTDDADRFRVTDPADLIPIANGLASGKLVSKRKNRYSVIVLDEGSSMYDTMFEQYIRDKYGLRPDDQLPEVEGRDYGPPTAAFESMLRKFHDVEGLHVIVTAHAREVGDAKELRPSLPPKAYNVLMRKAQICAAMSASRKKNAATQEVTYVREVQLQPSARVAAKSRMPNSPVKMSLEDFIPALVDWVVSPEFGTVTEPQSEELAEVAEPDEELDGDDVAYDDSDSEEADEEAPAEDDDDDDEFTEEVLRESLKTMTIGDIRNFAASDYDIDLTGVKKADAVERLVKYFFGSEPE